MRANEFIKERKKHRKKSRGAFSGSGGWYGYYYGHSGEGETSGDGGGGESVSEARDKMYQYLKNIVPAWPEYIVKDWLYANFAKGPTQTKNWSFADVGKDIPNMLNDMGLSANTKWQLIPDMQFTMDMWEPKTLKRLQARAGGNSKSSDPDVHIPTNDAERHVTQARLAKQQGGIRKEPVILIKTSEGYELIEGWHRTIQHFAMYPKGYAGPAYVAVAQSQQDVSEAFDNPYAFKWDRGDFGDYDIYVKLPDGNSLTISFNNEDKDNDVWHVAFARGHSQEITGEGDAQRIFATVLHSIKQFIGKVHPEKLYFSASKKVEPGQNSESRANLYSRMVQRYANAWGYDAVTDDFGKDNVTYILNKKQPVTEEEFNGIDIDMDIEGDEIMVTATGNGRELGHVLFVDEGEYLMPQDLKVDERFQGQGIAAAMYDYVKSKGYKIRRSGQQTDAGAGFWGKHRPEQNVWEDSQDDIKLTHTMSPDMLYVHASQDGSDAGGARFKKIDGEWTGDIVHVYPQFRRQGIATKMYNYAEDLVGKIIPSKTLKPKGKKFWASRVDRKIDESTESTNHVLFLGPNSVIVGQEHGKPLKLSDEEQQKIKDIADKYGAWYEGNGMDQKHTKGIIDDYKGSWDDDLLSPSIKGYPSPFLYVLFSNIKENDTVDGKIGFDPKSTIFDRILDTQPSTNYFPDRKFDAETLQKFLKSVSEDQYDFVKMSQAPATEKNVRKFFTQGEKLMFPDNWEEYPYRAGRVAKSVNDLRDKFLATRKKGVYVAGSDHLKAVQQFLDQPVTENFADGKIKGKHRPEQNVWESTADDINKMFNNMYDPMTTNLQRVALMAMQGRQDEAVMQLNRVIKDASPEAQKKITDAVNNIKPVTVNGKIADSSTLDKSKKHQDWILNTFIPWVQSLLSKQDVAEQLVETQFAVNRNPARGLWQLRMPKPGAPLVDETNFVVLKDAKPWQAPEGKEKLKITNFIVGDETNEKPTGEGRQVGYVKGSDYPFVYMDTMQPYHGSKYVIFHDRKFLAFDELEENINDKNSTPTMGINVRSDGDIDYASLIIDGKKKYESRQTDSLRPYVGKTVAIVRTGKGPAVAIGQVTVGEPVVVDAEKFDKMRKLHLVPQGSKFDIGPDATKYLYPMINPVRWDNEKLVKQKGIVARKIDESFPGKNKNKIYNLLINTIDSGPFDGGCVVFAQALQIKFGGEIMVLTGVHGADHAVLSLNGKLIDADGPAEPNEFVHRFEKNELAKITGIRPIHSKDLPDAPRSTELATQIAKLL